MGPSVGRGEGDAPAARFPMEQVSLPEPALEQLVPEAAIPLRSKVRGLCPSVTLTLAFTPVTVAREVSATVADHPPSVPALTWFWSAGVEEGTWKVGLAGGGSTVVEPRIPTPAGGVQVTDSVVGLPFITKVTAALMVPGTKLTNPVPGPVCQVTGL
jgi:hypothetical protein